MSILVQFTMRSLDRLMWVPEIIHKAIMNGGIGGADKKVYKSNSVRSPLFIAIN